jgi:hypothetical protein
MTRKWQQGLPEASSPLYSLSLPLPQSFVEYPFKGGLSKAVVLGRVATTTNWHLSDGTGADIARYSANHVATYTAPYCTVLAEYSARSDCLCLDLTGWYLRLFGRRRASSDEGIVAGSAVDNKDVENGSENQCEQHQ